MQSSLYLKNHSTGCSTFVSFCWVLTSSRPVAQVSSAEWRHLWQLVHGRKAAKCDPPVAIVLCKHPFPSFFFSFAQNVLFRSAQQTQWNLNCLPIISHYCEEVPFLTGQIQFFFVTSPQLLTFFSGILWSFSLQCSHKYTFYNWKK